MADETASSPRELRGEELIPERPRVIAVKHDRPGLRVALRVAERGERHAHLEDPAVLRDLRRGVPVEVGGAVLSAEVVADGVVLDPPRVGEEKNPRSAIFAGFDDDPAIIE